ncbi:MULTISPECIES: hypothetical protein [Burkholderia]|uniref:hypothetical protein n=1 Tax=Burkholderia TaxID=32008 RepID=UPI0008A4B2E3|nr:MULTISPECIES: hypothetical protein [Burkholderia]MBJ9682438.1 hypothetical protein [Burkholderia multivorans]OFT79715.1 hypothetical protein HMPREF3115_23600 [Burkholderia sp. HMSC10F09]
MGYDDEDFGATYAGHDEINHLWGLSDDFSVVDAAALVAGYEPTFVERHKNDTFFDKVYPNYAVAFKALMSAITSDRLRAKIRYSAREYGYADQMADLEYSESQFVSAYGTTADDDETLSEDKSCFYKPFPDWSLTTVSRDDLVSWLSSRGVKSGFFFPESSSEEAYLDARHPRYSPKLAAAIKVWLAMEDGNLYEGKAVLKTMEDWLSSRYVELGLVWEGKINKAAISECARVANWKTSGGAPSTPGS